MKKHINFYKTILILVIALIPFVGLQAQELTAEEAVTGYIDVLLRRVEEVNGLYESDQEKYFEEIELVLSEFVDFREAARGVMAKYSTGENGATAEQLDRFSTVFRTSMVDFYGSALASYNGEEYEFLENRRPPRDPESASNVRMVLTTQDGSRLELQYTMFLNDELDWKMKNLYVEGVNLRRQYYSRFDSQMARYNYDIDAVIDNWLVTE